MFEDTVESFEGFNISQLSIDQAWLNITTSYLSPVWIYAVSDACRTCPFQKLLDQPILSNLSYKVISNVRYGSRFRFRSSGTASHASVVNDSGKICDIDARNIGEFGVYSLFLEDDRTCYIKTDLESVNIYLPMLIIFAFWLLTAILTYFISSNWTRLTQLLENVTNPYFRLNEEVQEIAHVVQPPREEIDRSSDRKKGKDNDNSTISDESSGGSGNVNGKSGPSNKKSLKVRKVRSRHLSKKRKNKREHGSSSSVGKSDESQAIIPDDKPSCSTASTIKETDSQNQRSDKERVKCLDAFRGLCIIIMIFVDDGSGGFYFFQHCPWDGLYVADLAFPWFLWICGVCVPLSIHSKIRSHSSKFSIFKGICSRSLKLVLLGIIVNTSTRSTSVQLENLRLPGVLQRFGISYFIGSTLFLMFSSTKINSLTPNENQMDLNWKSLANEFKVSYVPWLFVMASVALHTSLIFFLPVPGCPLGYLGPAGLHNNNSYPAQCVGGTAGYLDRLIFGINHIHNRPTSQQIYGSGPFDPEGLGGCLTSILHIWLGIQGGMIFIMNSRPTMRLLKMLLWVLICGIGGIALCGGYENMGLIPVNKNLWFGVFCQRYVVAIFLSLSFVLVTISGANIVLCLLYFIIDVWKFWEGSPLMESGQNSILLYLGHEICHATLPWHFSYGRMRTHSSRLLESCWGTMLWIVFAVGLHKRQLFFNV